jgi:hypothetical protein
MKYQHTEINIHPSNPLTDFPTRITLFHKVGTSGNKRNEGQMGEGKEEK